MDHAEVIERFGYLATFLGSLLEGETLLILSGFAAHRGYLQFMLVVAIGALGGALGDMGFYFVGRHFGSALLDRFPRFAPAADRVTGMIERHPVITIMGVRFMYGLRAAGPAIIGTTRIGFAEFACFNALGALLWSTCWVGAGWLFGKAAERLLGDLAHVEREFFGVGILLAIAGAIGYRVWRGRARS